MNELYVLRTELACSDDEVIGLEYTFSDGSVGLCDFEELQAIKLSGEEFIERMIDSDYLFDELELRSWVVDYHQNLESFDYNKKNFFKYIEEEVSE